MGEPKLAQKLAKLAKEVQESSTGIHDMVKVMYDNIIEVASATAQCGKMGVRMMLIYPDAIKTPKAIGSANKKIIAMLEADGFSCPTIFSGGTGAYELRFQLED